MTKEHFLQELAARLHQLSAEEQEKVVAYYSEMISDRVENGNSEEAVIQDLGAPETIAQQICADHDKAAETMPPQTFSPEAGGERCYAAADSVQKIVVSAQNVHVNVRSVPSGSVRVLFDPLPNDKVTVTENGGVFTFTQTMQFHLFSWFGLFRSHYGITLEIPESFSGDVCVSTCNARLTAEHLRQLKSTEFVTDNARIVMSGLECETLRVRTSNGKVELENCSGTVCTVKTNNARITALNCSFSEGVDFHTENASISADRIISDTVTLKTTNASINSDLLKAGTITLKTNNASINATVAGDARSYAIHSRTSNGQNNLPADWTFPGQTKQLSAETNNAHISVTFIPET